MPTINADPVTYAVSTNAWTWSAVTEGDTAAAIRFNGTETLAASVQFTGTFGGATAVLQGSNDNTNWVTVQDLEGADISFTSSGAADFSSAMLWLRVSFSGGTSQSINAILVTRG